MVEHRRLELLTPTLPVLCATSCANAPNNVYIITLQMICKGVKSSFFKFFVSASNIGYTKARERSQGKGGDLRSKYNLTLTVVRKKYNGRGLFGKPCRTALDTLSCGAPAGFTT